MSETDAGSPPANSNSPEAPAPLPPPPSDTGPAEAQEEQIRKVYVRALKEKDNVYSVFRVGKKVKNTGRSGKSFLAVTLQDKTGEIDARVFDNVDAADAAFTDGDYLLVKASVI